MKILVVEDENALREVIVRSLEKERYVVESASSFREASLKINDYDYDCIVLDIMLPGGSGLTLLKELRALRKKDSIMQSARQREMSLLQFHFIAIIQKLLSKNR